MKKLIFFDIDGTIVSEGKDRIIPDSMYDTLHKLQNDGHLCFVNTGRTFAEIDDTIMSMNFDGFVCGCGTHIMYHGEDLLTNDLEPDIASSIIRDLEDYKLEWLLEGRKYIYYSDKDYHTHIGDFKAEHRVVIPNAFREIAPDDSTVPEYDKLCICIDENSDFESFRKKYDDTLTFIDRKNNFFELMPKGFSKASGIQFLENYFSITHENTIAIGDSTNDLPMLEYAGFSIAMGNSAKELLDVVDYVTTPLLEDGIYNAMKHLKLL